MKLNPAQQLAVNTIEGPVMVVAGPGTGKTQIIAERIANILKQTDTPPDAILALTFTESGAKAMKERLLQAIGETAYYVNIFTFHSFCSSVIQEFPDRFIISKEMESLSDLERVEIFHQILNLTDLDHLKPPNQPFYYTPALIKAIQDLKREAITPPVFKSILKKQSQSLSATKLSKTAKLDAKKQLLKNQELLQIYIAYQKTLRQRGRYDFEDMINLVVEAFKRDQSLLRTYQERLHYFLVDEYQDTNSAQNQVVDLLASYWGDQANVFVVGDSNQSIYRFQGASLENTISFTKTYPTATIITLDQNYRSTQTILDASFQLIQKNHFKIQDVVKSVKPQLKSQKKIQGAKINLVKLPSETLETFWLVNQVKTLISQGVKSEDIVVLYRHNADASQLADIFAKFNIPIDIEGGGNVLKDPAIKKLFTLFRAINNSPKNLEDLDLFTLLHYEFFDFHPLDILKLTRAANQKKSSIIDTILSDNFKKLKLKQSQQFIQFINQLTQWQQLNSQLHFSEFFETIIKQSGFLDWLISRPDATEKLNRLNSLFSEIKRLNQADHQLNLNSFLKALDLMDLNHLKITEQDLDIKTNTVTLSTAHKAKGKEWLCVFIYQAIDGKWGNNRFRQLIKLPQAILKNTDLSKKEKNEDERRLFYVCLTRAKKQIFISHSDRYTSATYLKEALPTMFISELPQKLTRIIAPKATLKQANLILKKFLQPPPKSTPTTSEKTFLKTIAKDLKLSPTALNTYLACAYKFKLNNLIRVPRAKQPYLSFGTAVHRALEIFHRQFIKDDKHPNKQYLLNQFQAALKKEVLTKSELKTRLKQGRQILSAYYDYYQDDFQKPLFTEKFFGFGWSKVFLGDIPLAGKVDRIDWLDQADRTVRVIDYKTGKPKTRNQILGKTKDSEGDYYRQLVFYKLLAQLDQSFPPQVIETEIDFVEPQANKKFRKERFKISSDDIKDLRRTIKKTMKEIRSLNFSRTQDYSKCTRCEYQSHCWPNGLPTAPEQLKLV